jgi:2'-5' RNA ligase
LARHSHRLWHEARARSAASGPRLEVVRASDSESKHVRLFVGLEPDAELRRGLAEWARRELRDGAVAPVPERNLHLTLCFLGWVPEERVDEAAGVVRELEPRPVSLEPRPEPVAKPDRRPRLFAIDVLAPAAVSLQAELSQRLEERGLYEPERRVLWTHITVARVRAERGKRRPARVRTRPGPLPAALVRTFDSVRVALYRSHLRPTGAEYVPLASLELPPMRPPRRERGDEEDGRDPKRQDS